MHNLVRKTILIGSRNILLGIRTIQAMMSRSNGVFSNQPCKHRKDRTTGSKILISVLSSKTGILNVFIQGRQRFLICQSH